MKKFSGQATFGISTSETTTSTLGFQQSFESTSTSINPEVAVNFQQVSDQFSFRARVGVNAFVTMPEEGDSQTSSNVVVATEADWMLSRDLGLNFSAQSFVPTEDDGVDDVPISLGGGVFYRPDDRTQIGLGYRTQTGDVSGNTFLIQARRKF